MALSGVCIGLVEVDERLKRLGVSVAYTVFSVEKACGESEGLREEIEKAVAWARSRFKDPGMIKDDKMVRSYRSFLWKLGIDPTKIRPSSEALLRRAVRVGSIPMINLVVDAGNVASMESIVPIGLYDMDRLSPPTYLTISRGSQKFSPIGGKETVLEAGYPILVDSSGRVVHVYPHRDSEETKVTCSTRRVLAIAAGVHGVDPTSLVGALKRLSNLLEIYAGGKMICEPRVV
ncbi:MAG: hypothetical protein F7B20_04310 [Aeropyrum sp.]|nr:hypothetical protein [Aeropyrum sp.]MCE4616345.1 hypothetical protein [Aeropyrum sp.]